MSEEKTTIREKISDFMEDTTEWCCDIAPFIFGLLGVILILSLIIGVGFTILNEREYLNIVKENPEIIGQKICWGRF